MIARPRSAWHVATVVSTRPETPGSARIDLDVAGWPGNEAGQHLDVRLTAPDGYTATRSYSIASSGGSTRVVLAVDRVPDGEVSPFLVDELRVGDRVEVHGPLGGFFVWRPDPITAGAPSPGHRRDPDPSAAPRPVQLVGGGSGVVPLFAMASAHAAARDATPFRLLYSVRSPSDLFFADELAALATGDPEQPGALRVDLVYTRRAPDGDPRPVGRITRERLEATVLPAGAAPRVFVCGSTGFVEAVASWLLELGHRAQDIRTERFGGT
ncbi:FAD-binding oxidoreductase [Occultella glacieicola]|uniref:FAD-binding oxidoreductase n=1 Tax=Occultella glacieicola TaxID=2518684 RepID=UPI001F3D81DB|nr:FAD-binding oxidoreductase [Occultella glacieicola]